MRLFIIILILIFNLQSLTKADDIRDFQIEGMSIGDSLLEYFSTKEIKKNIETKLIYPSSNKFSIVLFYENKKFKNYSSISINFLTGDDKFIIYGISGINYYGQKIKNCLKKKDEILIDLKNLNLKINETKKIKSHQFDKSKKSKSHMSIFEFDNGDEIRVECHDWTKKMTKKHNLEDQLIVSTLHSKFAIFLTNEAYK